MNLILLVFAFVFATIAVAWKEVPEPNRARLIAASLAAFYLSLIFGSETVAGWFHR